MTLGVTLSDMTDNASNTLPEIVLTRPEKEARDFSNRILSRLPEVKIIISPLITIKFTKPKVDLTAFEGIIFTSSNGVEAVKNLSIPQNMPCFAVGPKTAQKASELGFLASQGPGNSDDLITLILSRPSFGRLLHISGEHTRGNISKQLTQAGHSCERIVAYKQETLSLTTEALDAFKRGKPLILPLFSPRTAQLLITQNVPLEQSYMIALSEAVAEPFKGFNVSSLTVAKAPNSDSMLNDLTRTFEYISSLEAP